MYVGICYRWIGTGHIQETYVIIEFNGSFYLN